MSLNDMSFIQSQYRPSKLFSIRHTHRTLEVFTAIKTTTRKE